ncbi:hypothetical protein IQ07DRAFT_653578 [Pyrenochaeta sp. DS3sAY3a]|nr:hypothetical protein IQ07DRAFT_653578 [Pyrenochaeta sp. DS3sAY3a]
MSTAPMCREDSPLILTGGVVTVKSPSIVYSPELSDFRPYTFHDELYGMDDRSVLDDLSIRDDLSNLNRLSVLDDLPTLKDLNPLETPPGQDTSHYPPSTDYEADNDGLVSTGSTVSLDSVADTAGPVSAKPTQAQQGLGIFIVDDNNEPLYLLKNTNTPFPAPSLAPPPRPSGLRSRRPHTPNALNLNLHTKPGASPTPAEKSLLTNLKPRGLISCRERPPSPYPSSNVPLSPSQRRRVDCPITPGPLSAGPAGYAFTPLALRSHSYESLHDDHGIVLRNRWERKWGFWWRRTVQTEDSENVKAELMKKKWARNKEVRFEDEEGWGAWLKVVLGMGGDGRKGHCTGGVCEL